LREWLRGRSGVSPAIGKVVTPVSGAPDGLVSRRGAAGVCVYASSAGFW
jgi:hypothetical protein